MIKRIDISNHCIKTTPGDLLIRRTSFDNLKLFLCSSLLLLISLNNNLSFADETLSTVIQRMKSATVVKTAYQEIKTLELMEQPWHGSGYMYSVPPDLMIKEQRLPQPLLMGVKGNKMYYFDPFNNTRRQAELELDNPMMLNFAVFKALITADEVLLDKVYKVNFSSDHQEWIISLKPKKEIDSTFNIIVSGLNNKRVNKIVITQEQGDFSEFTLNKEQTGKNLTTTVDQLFQTLVGE